MYIKCKNGLICEIRSNLMNRYYLFYRAKHNPEKQIPYKDLYLHNLKFVSSHLFVLESNNVQSGQILIALEIAKLIYKTLKMVNFKLENIFIIIYYCIYSNFN